MIGHPKNPPIRDDGFRDFIRSRPCVLADRHPCECKGYLRIGNKMASRFCHVRTRRNNGDVKNGYPGCDGHHDEQHRIGIKGFEKKYNLDLRAIAEALWDTYTTEGK